MRILLTGGAGFIGSHVAERLLDLQHQLTLVDDCNDYYDPRLKEANLACLRARGPVDLHRHDIRDEAAMYALFDAFRPEAVIHLAARAGVQPSLAAPVLYEQVNCGGTLVLLEAARRAGCRRFVFASSSSVYGETSRIPFREDDPALRPISPYAATKIAAEKLCCAYAHLYAMATPCLRLFTVYGPRQRPDLAIRKFIDAIQAGRPVTLYGDGTTSRDYTYVDDTVSGIIAALGFEGGYDVFNLGAGRPVRLDHLVEAIENALGRKALIERRPLPAGDVPITFADIGKARAVLGYQPSVALDEGIRRTVDWLRTRA